jgi:glucose-6-phosphate isomerase
MALTLNDKYVRGFVDEGELSAIQTEISAAHKTLLDGSGEGSDFLGWETFRKIMTRKNLRG